MLVVADPDHHGFRSTELDGGVLVPSWEHPGRADLVDEALQAAGYPEVRIPGPLDDDLLAAIHDPGYLRFLATAWDRWVAAGREAPAAMGFGFPMRRFATGPPDDLDGELGWYAFALDCSITAETWSVARRSAAAAQDAARLVAGGERLAFARCRPPGHHAGRDHFGGYCYLNNAGVAAEALRRSGADRVAVVDIDYHHGNGTQDVFWRRADVVTCSLHADPRREFPWFSGHADEIGDGPGRGHNHNFPLPIGCEVGAWSAALDEALARVDDADALVVALGVDTHEDDPISRFRLRTEHYPAIGRRLAAFGRPTVVVLEGGYAPRDVDPERPPAMGRNVVAVLDGMTNGPN